ncbi:MAG: hypothetical protein R3F22_03295 [Lysobacteraceae bacterium]
MIRALSWLAAALGALLLLVIAARVAWLLGGNPGYFSHDELQWAAFAQPSKLASAVGWFDIGQFQYRPLTFRLWMLLSRVLFETPRCFHALWLLLGAVNAALFGVFLRRVGCSLAVSGVAGLLFWLNPYAVFVHGWVGTLADLLWVMAALLLALVQTSSRLRAAPRWQLLLVAVLTTLALMAKEAALSIPALLFVAWLFLRQHAWRNAFLVSATVAAVYLLLRFAVLTDVSHEGSGYGVDLVGAPLRFLHYQLFPLSPWAEEIHTLAAYSHSRLAKVAVPTLLLWLFTLGSVRYAAVWLLLSLAALGPALLIASSSNQYGYGLGAVLIGIAAWRWRDIGAVGRGLQLFAALVLCWHALGVAHHVRRAGDLQAVYSPSLAAALADSGATLERPLGLRPDCDDQRWVYQRLSFQIPRYDDVPIGGRVRILAPDEADTGRLRRIACDGRVYLPD